MAIEKFKVLQDYDSPQARIFRETGKMVARKLAFEGALRHVPSQKDEKLARVILF